MTRHPRCIRAPGLTGCQDIDAGASTGPDRARHAVLLPTGGMGAILAAHLGVGGGEAVPISALTDRLEHSGEGCDGPVRGATVVAGTDVVSRDAALCEDRRCRGLEAASWAARRGEMTGSVEVAIVGAGPYGLSLAAHLRAAGVSYRQFGLAMHSWRTNMPRGMYLTSPGSASDLSDPHGRHTLRDFCRESGMSYADDELPISLDTFLDYGDWFRGHHAPGLEEVLVTQVTSDATAFEITLANGDRARARNVVVATGLEHFARMPPVLSDLPERLCTHSSRHNDLGMFSGARVVVIGAGQSALETAALLNEHGARVDLLVRSSSVVWNDPPENPFRPPRRSRREPGSGLACCSAYPWAFRSLPEPTRAKRVRVVLRPSGAWWLRERVEGRLPVHTGHLIEWAEPHRDRVRLGVRGLHGPVREFAADHVISATGYAADLRRLRFLDRSLRARISIIDGTPLVDEDFESSQPGLFFIGAAVVPTFGPVMRFIRGADFAARRVAARFAPRKPLRSTVVSSPSS